MYFTYLNFCALMEASYYISELVYVHRIKGNLISSQNLKYDSSKPDYPIEENQGIKMY